MHRLHSSLAGVASTWSRPSCHKRALSISLLAALATPMVRFEANASPSAPENWVVKNCNDSGADSLRDIIQNPAKAKSGDSVDLSQLPVLCGMQDSRITLDSEIVIPQDSLTLIGSTGATVSLAAANATRVFHHTGTGTLDLNALAISDGLYRTQGNAYGGCIESDDGDLYLNRVFINNCGVYSYTGFANGGGLSARTGNVVLIDSSVTWNGATSGSLTGFGGGVYSGGATLAKYSTIRYNATGDGPGQYGFGGGIAAMKGATITGSTIAQNKSGYGSGIFAAASAVAISNSTVSLNFANAHSAVDIFNSDSATVSNSTIVLNHDEQTAHAGAVSFYGSSASSLLTLQSSILALSGAGPDSSVAADLYLSPGNGTLAGSDNLVMATNANTPPGVVAVNTDPHLGPLQFNGGTILTHALLSGSPALAIGNNTWMLIYDQRGRGYPRTSGTNGTVDIGAVQFDEIFISDFD